MDGHDTAVNRASPSVSLVAKRVFATPESVPCRSHLWNQQMRVALQVWLCCGRQKWQLLVHMLSARTGWGMICDIILLWRRQRVQVLIKWSRQMLAKHSAMWVFCLSNVTRVACAARLLLSSFCLSNVTWVARSLLTKLKKNCLACVKNTVTEHYWTTH